MEKQVEDRKWNQPQQRTSSQQIKKSKGTVQHPRLLIQNGSLPDETNDDSSSLHHLERKNPKRESKRFINFARNDTEGQSTDSSKTARDVTKEGQSTNSGKTARNVTKEGQPNRFNNPTQSEFNQVTLTPEDDEDLWNVYNLISIGDLISSQTQRKLKGDSKGGGSDRSSRQSRTIKLFITIAVKNIDYDIECNTIKLNGTNCVQNEFIKLGAYHSITIEPNRSFKMKKEHWDHVDNELLNQMKDLSKKHSVAAIVLEEGVAHICLVKSSSCQMLSKISHSIAKKHKIFTGKYSDSLEQFYSLIVDQIFKLYDLKALKCIVLASPGFFNSQLLEHLRKYDASEEKRKLLRENLHKFMTVHSANGYLDSLHSVLGDPKVSKEISEFGVAQELRHFEQFQAQLFEDEYKALYGYNHVKYCIDNYGVSCIKTLMLIDSLYRSKNLEERIKYSDLCKDVKSFRAAKFLIFSARSESGRELANLGGIAAILHYPINEIDDINL